MALEKQDGYVLLERDPQTGGPVMTNELRQLLMPEWLRQILRDSDPVESSEFERVYWEQVSGKLKEISENNQNWMDRGVPVGKSKLKVGNKSIPVKELLLVGLAYSVPAYIAISAIVAGPASLVLAAKAAAAVAPMASKYYAAVNTYSPTELDVHTAVVAAINRNADRVLRGDGVTLEEIERSLKDLSMKKPASLKAVLDDMASDKKRMLLRSVEGGLEVFKPNPF